MKRFKKNHTKTFNLKRNKYFFVMILFMVYSTSYSQDKIARVKQKSNLIELKRLEEKFAKEGEINRKAAYALAKEKGWAISKTLDDGSFIELQEITDNGLPIYYQTSSSVEKYVSDDVFFSNDAAISTRTNHINSGGSLGLSLDGQDMTISVWDGGHALTSHQEYDGDGGNNRVKIMDEASEGIVLSGHAAGVSGIICSSGVNPAAKGMAPQATVNGYRWSNDLSEATTAAANGMLISSQSYGLQGENVPDQYYGAYIQRSKNWDALMYNAPYYLMVTGIGNGGLQDYNGAPLDGVSGYDKAIGRKTCKNGLSIANGQDANVNEKGELISVNIRPSSGQGPTDDYRIKPDITGNGTGVYCSDSTGDKDYSSRSGASFATPNVSGTLLLFQQHYANLNDDFMRSATLKGLALHTADDAGISGPDPIFGWGLLNAKAAAEAISTKDIESKIEELTLNTGASYSITVNSDGLNPLMASISWTDPEGVISTETNSKTPVLINDLDIRVTKNSTSYMPYRLTGVTTNDKGDNLVDPFERVDVENAIGSYTITVTHKGSLSGGSQDFSLIVTGLDFSPLSNTDYSNTDFFEKFELYPNPTSDKVTIKSKDNANGVVKIITLKGQELLSKPFNNASEVTFDLTNKASGVYLMKVSIDNTIYTTKILKK